MARRVFLHIGTMKSATSYIQHLCELNADHLSAAGMLWPSDDLRYRAVRDLFGRRAGGPDFTGAWARLAQSIRRYDGDVLVSNELLAALNGRHVQRLVKAAKAEVHVVLTARDHGRLLPSHWQTTIKNGRTLTWSRFASAVCAEAEDTEAQSIHDWFWQRHDLVSIVTRWQKYVPAERISLVTVPPPGGGREGVAQRFGSVIGVDLRGLRQPESWTNSSLGAHSVELMRRVNEQVVDVDHLERSRGYLMALGEALALHADKEPGFALSQAQQDWSRRRALAANSEIDKLGIRVEGRLDDLVPADSPPPGVVDPSDTTETELLRAAERGMTGMASTVTRLTLARKEVAAELRATKQQNAKLEQTVARLRRRTEPPSAATNDQSGAGAVAPRSPAARAAIAVRAAQRRFRPTR